VHSKSGEKYSVQCLNIDVISSSGQAKSRAQFTPMRTTLADSMTNIFVRS
jgi:hypothetical protein